MCYYMYLENEALEDSKQCCCTRVHCEDNIVDLHRIDSAWVAIRVLFLKGMEEEIEEEEEAEEEEEGKEGELGGRGCKGRDDGRGGGVRRRRGRRGS